MIKFFFIQDPFFFEDFIVEPISQIKEKQENVRKNILLKH